MFLRKLIIFSLIAIFSFSLIVYGIYKATPLILGPNISVASPTNGQLVSDDIIEVRGTVLRTKSLRINGIPTPFNEQGLFDTRLPIYPYTNLILIEATDRFGRSVSTTEIIGHK